jgi:peptidoglycan/LPS O-acetylase OafA/YrhL
MTQSFSRQCRAPSLTGARFIAAGAVLGFHLLSADPVPHIVQRIATFGRCGVCFFFVLSGFVMTLSYSRTFGTVTFTACKKFLLARGCRILPMHVFTLLMITPLALHLMQQGTLAGQMPVSVSHAFELRVWLANLFLVQVYHPRIEYQQMFNAPAWSVACEVFFYLCFPFLIAVLQKITRSVTQIAVLGGLIWLLEAAAVFALIYWLQPPHGKLDERTFDFCIGRSPLIRIAEFTVGCCAGLVFQRKSAVAPMGTAESNRLLLLAGAALLLGFGAMGSVPYFKFTFWFLAVTPGTALLVMGLAGNGHVFRPLLENKPMLLLGESSYALYLLQWTAVLYFRQSRFGILHLPALLAIMLGCVVASVVVHVLLERRVCGGLRRKLVDCPRANLRAG